MLEEVYEYLYDYGFDDSEIDAIENENEQMFFTDLEEVRKNIAFLEGKFLTQDDIIDVINSNPFMLTEKDNRLDALEEIYNCVLEFDYESIIKLIKANPEAFTISPIELTKIIDYLKTKDYNIIEIKELFIKEPRLISMNFTEFGKNKNFN